MRFNVTTTCQTLHDDEPRTFIFPFVDAIFRYNILGSPFFEKHAISLDIEKLSLSFENWTNSNKNTTSFTSHKEKDFTIFSSIQAIRASKKFHHNQSKLLSLLLQLHRHYLSKTMTMKLFSLWAESIL